MNIFDLVNSDSEENIAKKLGLSLANDQKSYVCPECGNGSGQTGDGIKQSTWNGRFVWHCYRCGGHWSNVDLIALVKGIGVTDTKELAKELELEYPEYNAGKFSSFKENSFAKQAKSESSSGEPKNYGKTFYPRYKETAKKFLEERGVRDSGASGIWSWRRRESGDVDNPLRRLSFCGKGNRQQTPPDATRTGSGIV